jgi:hypothetical protein
LNFYQWGKKNCQRRNEDLGHQLSVLTMFSTVMLPDIRIKTEDNTKIGEAEAKS